MSPSVPRAGFALFLALLAASPIRADDLTGAPVEVVSPGEKAGPNRIGLEVVPARPDLVVWAGQRKMGLRRADAIFVVEQVEGERVAIRQVGDGRIGGLVAERDLVPLDRAEEYFSARIRADSRSAFPYLMRAAVRYHLHQTRAAMADLDEALRIDPRCAAALERRAWIAMDQGRREPARDDLERAIQIDPTAPDLFFTRASYHRKFDGEKPELAIADLDREIQLDPTNARLFLSRAVCNLQQHRHKECLADIGRALELGGPNPAVFLEAMKLMVEAGEERKARQAVEQRLALHPDADLAYRWQIHTAVIDARNAKFPKAMLDLRRAIDLDPGKADAYLMRSSLRTELGFPPWMVRHDLDEAIRADPGNARAYLARSLLRSQRHEYAAALADLDAAVRVAPEDAGVHERRAWLLATCPDAKVRNGPEAVASATLACEVTGWNDPRKLTALAAAAAEAGDFRAAVAHQERAISLLPQHDGREAGYDRALDRYRAGKPGHRLGLIEEIGLRPYQPAGQTNN